MDKVVEEIGQILSRKNLTLCTAESFTSGKIAAAITSVPGASEYFKEAHGILKTHVTLLQIWNSIITKVYLVQYLPM